MKPKILLLLFIVIAGILTLTLMPLKARAMSANKENQLGWNYDSGNGVPQSYAKATYWWKKAAAQGDVLAKYNLKKVQ